MAKRYIDATASRKVELAVNELGSLSVPPCIAVQYLSKLVQGRFSPASLAAGPVRQRHSVRLVLDRLDANDVRDALLRTKVTAGFEIEFADQQLGGPNRKDLILHSLAVACCARKIAEASSGIDPQLAWSAG